MSSIRSELVYRRTYSRPKENGTFETFDETIDRVIVHQKFLWNRAKRSRLSDRELAELEEFRNLMLQKKVMPAGRTLWLGGTDISRTRESSMFNCSNLSVSNVNDMVDSLWLLLQGCGVGFRPRSGTLNGFANPIPEVEVIRSRRKAKGGRETNLELWDAENKVWTISVGDSAQAWAKAVGKIFAGKYPAKKLVLDFSQLRPAGERLSGYGWISQGDDLLAKAMVNIIKILNQRAGQLLTKVNILDLENYLGTVLSSRRSAQICTLSYGDEEWYDFATAKKDYWLTGNNQRAQSNNSLIFESTPTQNTIRSVLDLMVECGGSEPGFINGVAARRRAPWFDGVNPCCEILLSDKGFCNLCTVNWAAFKDDWAGLSRAIQVVARANYRQTLVNLEDGILQQAWHENNQFLRLCGVSATGIVRRPDLLTPYNLRQLRNAAVFGARSMAEDLGTQIPKNVTTIKPEGTLSKLMDSTEGIHMPLGKHIFNHILFSIHDPLVEKMRRANYHIMEHPHDPSSVLIRFPVEWNDVAFTRVGNLEVNTETALDQLERYKLLMDNYVDQNASITISYEEEEIPLIAEWLHNNWSSYVGVSFIKKADPAKSAEDLGYPYLPQEVVDKGRYDTYVGSLKEVKLDDNMEHELLDEDCVGGVCPVR